MPRPTLDALIALALEAGREIMAVRDKGVVAMDKADGSPVTIADQRAEEVIEAGLARLAPGVPMLGEEAVAGGRTPQLGEIFFCVDPIDGTRDFIAGETGEFTVNIALVEHGAPVMGVVLAPATGALYAGEPGRALKGLADARAARIVEGLAPIAPSRHEGPWRVIASRHSGKNAATDRFMNALGPHERMNASSSIKFCKLAEGAADLYPRFGDVSEWDTAAGHAVLLAAGGGVMRHSGAPLTYG
ncbi:MAG: 3'(2'),5'-bisphosphate nucleotidase CysQ, partial [Hyphomonadaceae bacterium]